MAFARVHGCAGARVGGVYRWDIGHGHGLLGQLRLEHVQPTPQDALLKARLGIPRTPPQDALLKARLGMPLPWLQ